MSNTSMQQILMWAESPPRGEAGSRGVAAVLARGNARERRRVAKSLSTVLKGRHMTADDDTGWMRSALAAARDLEQGTTLVIEVSTPIPPRFKQFLRDLRNLSAVEVLLPSSQRSTTIRCNPMAGVIVMLSSEAAAAFASSSNQTDTFDLVVSV